MADDFIAGRHGNRTAQVLHPLMEPILKDTYGVILYQEQVMQITSALAGFSLGQADILRRAMGKKKAKELDSMRQDFVDGAKALHNISEELSEKIFSLLQHFAGYGFNKSHSVAYALVAYQTAYLKAHWPAQFMGAFLNSVIDDSDKLSWYISVCRDAGIKILPPDINSSGDGFTVQADGSIRFGLAGIKSLGENAVGEIMTQRAKGGPFTSLMDFCKRVSMRQVNKRVIENLIKSGSMDGLGLYRSQLSAILEQTADWAASWQKDNASGQIGLFEDCDYDMSAEITVPDLPEIPRSLLLQQEKELLGFYVTGHPLDDYKKALGRFMPVHQFAEENSFRDRQYVKVAGIIASCTLKNTKTGDTMALLTLEDFSGHIPIVVFPKTYRSDLRYIFQDGIVAIEGYYSADERERKIIASHIGPLPKEQTLVRIRIKAHLENNLTQRELGKIFKEFSGADPVYLDLLGSKKTIKTNADFWVNSKNPAFKEAILKLLGPDSLIL